ncbi:hypothetical protein GE09DRAFT_1229816 [Coniochaeta sp. 2T2.1]|nr:hypothetical protein GE09DRAFT_1229816 [Coniochaeta sp. 2T2.1]
MAVLNPQTVLHFRGAASERLLITARQNPVVTQTITRPYTTITAVVTLGPGSTSSPPPQATTTIISTSTSSPSSTTSSPVTIPGTPPASSTTLTHAQLGAILGAIFGSILLVILIWYCVSQSRRRREAEEEEARFRYVLSGESETSEETAEVRVREGGGGGGGTRRMGGMGWMGTGGPWRRAAAAEVPAYAAVYALSADEESADSGG